jgi:cholesterol transport system auxiliary component
MSICLATLVIGGCVSLSKSYPEKHYYALEAIRQGQMFASIPGTILQIRKLRAAPAFEGKELVYRTSDARYEGDFYNEWFVPPNAMLTQQALNWLTAAGLFHYVMDSSGSVPPTYILEGTVTALYGDYRATPTKAVLGLRLFLVHEASSHAEILWHQEYRKDVEVMDQTPEALVSSWNDALRIILTAVEADMKQALQPR